MPDFRPELLQNVARHIDAELHAELTDSVRGGVVIDVVGVGNGDRGRVSDKFRVIELGSAGITVRPEDLTSRISDPGPLAAGAAAEVTRILVQDGGENGLSHVIADDQIAVR